MLNDTVNLALTLLTSRLNNSNSISCWEKFSTSHCQSIIYLHGLIFFLFIISLFPQIIHLFNYRTRYIAGISYTWIIIRILALTSFMAGYTWRWSMISGLITIVSPMIIFIQILIFSNNLHRQNKFLLIAVSLALWMLGGSAIIGFLKRKNLLQTTGYLLFGIQMLPQILLNSFLRTTKALSKLSILLLLVNDILQYYIISIEQHSHIRLIAIYYSLSFNLYIYLQSIMYIDAHIHVISRSSHTVLTPGVDMFTGLDPYEMPNPEEDLESMDGSDIIYQAVSTKKSSVEPIPMKGIIWYAAVGWILSIEIIFTIVLIYQIRSLWIIFVPVSIPVVLGILFLLRTKLSVIQTERLRKIL